MTTESEMGGKRRRNAAFNWLRRIARRFGRAREFEGVDREEIEQIARDLKLSPAELYALSTKNGLSGDLLKHRLAEFGLSQGDVRSRHPEVFRDLQLEKEALQTRTQECAA